MVKRRTQTFVNVRRSGLPRVARAILAACSRGRHVVTFSGPLGAGKSTLIRAIGRLLGVRKMPSPTYVLVRSIRLRRRTFARLVHADLYRLRRGTDLAPLGLSEELMDPGALVLIEWPERAKLTPGVRVQLFGAGDRRTVRIRVR